jgi:hypothetical protein
MPERIDSKPDEKLELSLPFKLSLSPKYSKGNIHLTFGDTAVNFSIGEGDEKKEIMTIIACIGGGIEIQDELTEETWFLSFIDIADAYRPIQLERAKNEVALP